MYEGGVVLSLDRFSSKGGRALIVDGGSKDTTSSSKACVLGRMLRLMPGRSSCKD